jgi:RNA polymerase subunit RPABC4/transcription elongation factor Spt4
MELLIIVVLIGLIPATIAQRKGKSFVGWWIYGAALFIIALPHALMMRPDQKSIENKKLSEGMKKCPSCAELIKAEAKVCRYCGRPGPTETGHDRVPVGAARQEAESIARDLLIRWNSMSDASRTGLARQLFAKVWPASSANTFSALELKQFVSDLAAGRFDRQVSAEPGVVPQLRCGICGGSVTLANGHKLGCSKHLSAAPAAP